MADVRGFDELGNKILIPEDKVAETIAAGGRVATADEISASHQAATEQAVQDRYDALPLSRKALGLAGTIASLPAGPLGIGASPDAPPTLAAFGQGVRHGATAGLFDAGQRVAISKLGSAEADERFAQQQDQQAEASPIAHGLGSVTGMLGASALGTGAGPVGAISGVGAAAEGGLERALGGLATKGALGKAAAAAASMGVRGALEGAAYSGVEQASDNVLHDQALGEKLYASMGHGALMGGALGGLLGAGGSLAVSAKNGILGSLTRTADEGSTALAKGGRTVARQALDAGQSVEDFLRAKAANAITEGGTAVKGLAKSGFAETLANPTKAATDMANDQAWAAVGRGFGLQTSRYAKEAARHFGGTGELGAVALKYGLIDMGAADASPMAAAWQAAKSGTPADIAPRAAGALDTVGKQIGEITGSSGATISTSEIRAAFREARAPYAKIAGRGAELEKLNAYEDDLIHILGGSDALQGKNVSASIQDVLEQRKGLDGIIYGETKTLDPNGRVQILRDARSELESLITRKLDEASGLVPGEQKATYQALKKDYHALRIISDAADDSAARAAKGASLGLGEKLALATSVASGHLLGGPVLAVGGKMIKERGNAAAAAYLSRHAALGTFDNIVRKFDAKVSASAASVLKGSTANEAATGPRAAKARTFQTVDTPAEQAQSREQARAQADATLKQATGIVKWVGNFQGNPGTLSDQIEEAAATVGRMAGPKAAADYTGSTMAAVRFIAAHIPIRERRDPLDPRSTPPLTQDEAQTLVRATKYALKPETAFEDFGRGLITPEGLRAAKTLTPDSFATFQNMLLDHVTDHMMRNRQLTWSQRLQLDKLGIESIRPADVARLQANFMQAPPDAGPNPAGPGSTGAPPPPLNMKIQQSGFDSIEARHST